MRETWGEHLRSGGVVFKEVYQRKNIDDSDVDWRSPIFMPRWASRLMLTITSVRVERVQEISEADAKAEGIERINDHPHWGWKDYTGNGQDLSPIMSYQSLWDSLNSKRGYSWASNCFVWVLTFEVAK